MSGGHGDAGSTPRPRVGRVALTLAAVAVAALLGWLTWRDIRSETRRVEGLMLAQAQSIADVVTESGSHGFAAFHEWEDEVAARLLDNARWVARLDSVRALRSPDLARLARIHGLGRINLFDARGERVASSVVEHEVGLPERHNPRDYIAPILRGETRELRIGFKPARFRGGSRFAVAVARRGGGAIVVNVFADSMQAVLESVQPSHLLATLGRANGVRYVVVQDRDSLLAGSAGSPALDPPARDPDLAGLAPGGPPLVRELALPGVRAYEVARAVSFPSLGRAVLRVGLDPAPLDQARRGVWERALFRTAVFALLASLGLVLLLVWQRQSVLATEITRARAELRAREQEALRTAKLAAMGELAAHVAHEIRNPLNTIHMLAQQLAREAGEGQEARARAADMRAESERIEAIVQQFLTFARPRTPRLERLDVREAVSAAGRAAQPAFEAESIDLLVLAEPCVAALDPVLLGEILDNLLRNAREASPPGGRVTLSARRAGGEVQVAVEDQGPGVPAESRERVFDPFYTTKPRGSGLGLSLVSQMAAAMGGGVRIEEALGGGARFVLHVPADRGAA